MTERDFKISTSRHVSSGEVTLAVSNHGPDQHELIVVRAASANLPLRADGVTVDEDRLETETMGGLEPGGAGSVRRLPLHLTPGNYVLFCNMAGHYLGGMHAEIEVR